MRSLLDVRSSPRISRLALYRAAPHAVLRLALWLGLQIPLCTCDRCVNRAVERLARLPEMS